MITTAVDLVVVTVVVDLVAVTAALSLTFAVEVSALNQIPNYESLQR